MSNRPAFRCFLLLAGIALFALPGIPVNAQSGRGTSYRNCTAVRAAGAAPIRRGEPGYAAHLDRDGDGIACELTRGRGGAPRRARRR